jgi:hypothetical protein
MDVLQGVEYSIIKMPKNVSADTIDGLIKEFSQTTLEGSGQTEFLLDMDEIAQLHRACLQFINALGAAIKAAGGVLSIAGLQDAVENALRFNHVDETIPLFKNVIDFERQKEIVFDFGDLKPQAPPGPDVPVAQKKNNVLILDPSIASRNNQRLALSKLPVDNIIESKDPAEAMKRMRSISFQLDLIVADFLSIKPLAEEFIHSVRATPFCQTATIILTVNDLTPPAQIEEARAKGIGGTVSKNYGPDDIRQYLKK